MLWPSEALPMMFKVWTSVSDSSNVVQRQRSTIRWPTSSQVAVKPDDAAVPPTRITDDCPLGNVEPVNAVPTVTFWMVISPTGVVPKLIRSVLSSSVY